MNLPCVILLALQALYAQARPGIAPQSSSPRRSTARLENGQSFREESGLGSLPVAPRRAMEPLLERPKRGILEDDDVTGVLTLPVVHAAKRSLMNRAVETQLENRSDVAYYAQLQIGTPPQSVYAQLDTGSFELWVNPDCSELSFSDQRFCVAVGNYDPSRSSTARSTGRSKQLLYGIGEADVEYVLDDISLPQSMRMKQVQFGVATASEDQFAGILGIGYGQGLNTPYKNFIDQMSDQGVIEAKAFSLALGSKDQDEGAIIFGGIDTSKFQGELVKVPIIPKDESPDGVARYWVSLKSITHTPPSGGKAKKIPGTSMPVFLDSGATLTLLPSDVVRSMAAAAGSTSNDPDGFAMVDCELVEEDGSMDFEFNGVTIRVPYREMIREIQTLPPYCYLGVAPSDSFALLGDTFLRSAFVVFDLESNNTYIAPYSDCGSTLRSINRSMELEGLSGKCGDTLSMETNGDDGEPDPASSTSPPSPTAADNSAATDATSDNAGDSGGSDGGDDRDNRSPTLKIAQRAAIVTCIVMSLTLLS